MKKKESAWEPFQEELPVVDIKEVTDEQAEQLVEGNEPKRVNLGERDIERKLSGVIGALRKAGGRRFLLTWKGSKIPRGAQILGYEIRWTQNGQVIARGPSGNEDIGTYDRLVENGGVGGKEQKMIIYLYPPKKKQGR